MEPAVLVEREGHVLILTLNRPAKKNAFNPEVLCRLCDAYDLIDSDDDIRVAILTGADGNFSAGADLDQLVGKMMKGLPPENEWEERVRADYGILYRGFLKDRYVQKPLIAAIEGACYAGGTEILQGIDIRVAGESAKIAISEVKRGLFPMAGSTVRLRRQIAFTHAMELLLVGDPLTAAEAARIGLIGHVVPDGQALAAAKEIAAKIAENGPLAVKNIKRSVIETEFLPEAEAYKREQELGMAVMSSSDAREGPRAFLEKRKPNYTGR
ncbi:MAG: crotonase/enoyl-CoA hydratase family protein [Deltaproteobacteria bacterium]|nr:crotonase/enoyl-CoA hydratase family protein [Deltaproteobacteria bacterium]